MASGESMWPRRRRKSLVIGLVGVVLSLFCASPCSAVVMEQFPILSPKATALANTVTADPPDIMSIHFNPAGLSHLPEGKCISNGALAVYINLRARFDPDLEFDGFLNYYKPEDDPLAGKESELGGLVFFVPGVNYALEVPFAAQAAPLMGMSYRAPGSRWTFGFTNYAMYGGGWWREPDDPGRYGAEKFWQQHFVYASPGASYQLTDTLSLGVAVGMGQTALGQEFPVRAPSDMTALTKLLGEATEKLEIPVYSELTLPPPWFGGGGPGPWGDAVYVELSLRDDFSPNHQIGLLWEPTAWFSFGACYKSAVKTQLRGRFKMTYSDSLQKMFEWFGSSPLLIIGAGALDLPYKGRPYQSGMVRSSLEFPQQVQLGVMFKPFKRLKLLCDAHWAQWSTWKELRFTVDQDLDFLKLAKLLGYPHGARNLVQELDFKDTWHLSFGMEYQLTDTVALRLGYEDRKTSGSLGNFSFSAPIPTLDNYGAGIAITQPNGHKIELAFSYMVNKGLKIPDDGSALLNSLTFTDTTSPYAGLDFEQDFEAYFFNFLETIPFHF